MNISNTKFNELNIKTMNAKTKGETARLLKEIQAAELYGEIEDVEAAFLINQLNLDIDESVDTYRPEKITERSGGIRLGDCSENAIVRQRVMDELDEFDEEEEESESGFGFDPGYAGIKRPDADDLDDFEEEDESEEESGFFGMIDM